MKKGQGKSKGGEFERLINTKLSLWLSNGERKDIVCRSEGSGARFTSSFKKGCAVGTSGDAMAVHPLAFPLLNLFVLEYKHWKNLEILSCLQGKGELFKAVEKVRREAFSQGKGWWLVARQNYQPIILFAHFLDKEVEFRVAPYADHLLFKNFYMFELEKFFKQVRPENILGNHKASKEVVRVKLICNSK
jgi:hypothetical protein